MAIEGQNQPAGEQNQPNPAPGGDKGGQPNPQNQPADGGQPKGAGEPNPDEARRNAGILADLKKERLARQAYEKRIAELEAAHTAAEKRVRALAGVEPKSDEDAEAEQVKAQFTKMFPALAKLNDEQLVNAINQIIENQQSQGNIEAQYWQDRAQQMTDGVVDEIEKEFGTLTDRQKARIKNEYAVRAANDPEFLKRHEKGDKSLVAEFAKEYIEDVYGPVRKKHEQSERERFRPVPGGRDRMIAGSKPKSIDFKNPKAVEDAMVESFQSHGGRFDK
jgi:hypothetical protein